MGKKRIDLALVDVSNVAAIQKKGYLGTHEGTDSNPVVGYIYWDQQLLTQGLVSRPVRMRGRPVRIEQTDKIKTYLETLILKVEHQQIHKHTIDLLSRVLHKVRQGPDQ